jgi:hypothetical protein
MKSVIKQFGQKIAFIDSLFTVSIERVEKICRENIKNKLNIPWTCTIRANIIKTKAY